VGVRSGREAVERSDERDCWKVCIVHGPVGALGGGPEVIEAAVDTKRTLDVPPIPDIDDEVRISPWCTPLATLGMEDTTNGPMSSVSGM
jgi:hypothetical protein